MKKLYEEPQLEVYKFSFEDILETTSPTQYVSINKEEESAVREGSGPEEEGDIDW